jgi:hypothetical protein
MASITGTGSFGRARWLLGALLRQSHTAGKDIAEADRTPVRKPERKRWYPPRDSMFEDATMAREMYRL